MTPQTTAVARLPLDQATTDETLATIFGAQRLDPARSPTQVQTQRDAGAALISALHPRDPVEATYAARAAAAHYGSMECFRRAMLPDMPDSLGLRWHGKAVALSRMNTEMVRALKQCQAETPGAQPGARPAVPAPPSAETRLTAALAAELAARQARARAPDPTDPSPAERPSPTPAAATNAAQPAAAASGRQYPLHRERPSPTPAAATNAAQPAAAASGRQYPLHRERPSFTPAASVIMARPDATSLLTAPPPRPGLRAELLGSAADVAAMLAAATAQASPHVQ